MKTSSNIVDNWRTSTTGTLRKTAHWVWQGVVDIGHNSLAVLGLACIGVVMFFSSDSALRHQVERQALEWLNLRHGSPTSAIDENASLLAGLSDPDAVDRATARHLKGLPRNQALVANWLARRYRVAPEAVARLVQEAWQVGTKAKVEPTLILAIMAIESSFNPFAQSNVGAQGLMQVMTQVHDDKYAAFGGTLAAFDPLTNLRVGVQVLRECVARAGGDVELGLKYYVGAANLPTDGGYADKVLGEQTALLQVASGVNVQPTASTVRVASSTVALAAAAELQPGKSNATSTAPLLHAAPAAGTPAAAGIKNSVSPAAHASAGTVMAPAIGAALAANLSAPIPAPTPMPAPGHTSTATAGATAPKTESKSTPAATAAALAAPATAATPAAASAAIQVAPAVKLPTDTKLDPGRMALAGDSVR